MWKNCISIALTSTILFLFQSCAVLKELVKTPKVSVSRVSLVESNFRRIKLNFHLNIQNPNPFGANLNHIAYNFLVNGKQLLEGDLDKKLNIAANSKSAVILPISFKPSDLVQSISSIIKSPRKINYTMKAKLNINNFTVPVQKSGTVKLR